ncbi:MAG: hypothetical protein RBT71_06820 [Flavobacteriales bacterium]|jgi:hypothetical protein|nr:hypothetical protein [Flavobacteriales bacterium]
MLEPTDTGLRKLFQAAGHHRPGTDLTARIMARVAVTPMARPAPIKPLIGQWGWGAMAAAVFALVAWAVVAAPHGTGTGQPLFAPLTDVLARVRLPHGDWPVWAIGASVCVLLFSLLDHALARHAGPR